MSGALRQSIVLDADAIYLTPRGKRCRWVPMRVDGHLLFQYVGADNKTLDAHFTLAPSNLRLLRKVPG